MKTELFCAVAAFSCLFLASEVNASKIGDYVKKNGIPPAFQKKGDKKVEKPNLKSKLPPKIQNNRNTEKDDSSATSKMNSRASNRFGRGTIDREGNDDTASVSSRGSFANRDSRNLRRDPNQYVSGSVQTDLGGHEIDSLTEDRNRAEQLRDDMLHIVEGRQQEYGKIKALNDQLLQETEEQAQQIRQLEKNNQQLQMKTFDFDYDDDGTNDREVLEQQIRILQNQNELLKKQLGDDRQRHEVERQEQQAEIQKLNRNWRAHAQQLDFQRQAEVKEGLDKYVADMRQKQAELGAANKKITRQGNAIQNQANELKRLENENRLLKQQLNQNQQNHNNDK